MLHSVFSSDTKDLDDIICEEHEAWGIYKYVLEDGSCDNLGSPPVSILSLGINLGPSGPLKTSGVPRRRSPYKVPTVPC